MSRTISILAAATLAAASGACSGVVVGSGSDASAGPADGQSSGPDAGALGDAGGNPGSDAGGQPGLDAGPGLDVLPPIDLCQGLITDKLDHPMTALARPAAGQTAVDPQFGTTIRRLTNAGAGNVVKPAYSTIPAWNADESRLVLYHTGNSVPGGAGHHLYDGKTYAHLRALDIDPPDLEQFYWDTSDPDLLYYVDGANKLTRLHVGSGTKDVLHTFTCAGQVTGGGDPMFTSWDSDVFGLECNGDFFAYRRSTNAEGTRRADTSGSGLAPIPAPSGNAFFVGNSPIEVRDFDMNLARTIVLDGSNHASLGRLADGTDTFNGVAFDGNLTGTLVVADLSGATSPRVIVGEDTGYPYPPSGTHVSALAFRRPGWVVVSIVGATSGANLLDQELVLADTNLDGKVCRVAHHRSYGKNGAMDYWAEPHPVISPSGTRILFGSDWGNGGSVDSYVVELSSYAP